MERRGPIEKALDGDTCPSCAALRARLAALEKVGEAAKDERETTNKELSILAEFRRISYCVLDGHWAHYRDNPECKCSLCELRKLYYFGQGDHLVHLAPKEASK